MKKENDKIINMTSKEFPMRTFYGNISPQNQKPVKPIIKLYPDLRNGFNNESPDFFRMDSMKENQTSYKNPFLNVVKTCDRSLFYKNNLSCIQHINLINKAKSKRELSQNPKVLKQLNFSTDINILENNLNKDKKIVPYMYKTLSSDFDNMEFLKNIKKLNGEYLPNHHYLTKNSFNMTKINENQLQNSQGFLNGNDNTGNVQQNNNNNYNNHNREKSQDTMNLENNNNNNSKSLEKTSFAFNKENITINENDMERGVENNNIFKTSYPKNENENTCNFLIK